MKLTEAEMRMVFQIESTNQNAALNEIYMTWRYAPNPATKETAEGLLDKLRPLSDQECMDLIRKVQAEYRLPEKARTIGEMLAEARQQSGAQKLSGHDIMALERFDPATRHRYKTHKVDLTGWNDKGNALLWRKAWADISNAYLERAGHPERIDHRSNAERGIDELPTVHMGVAACQMEKKGIATEKGELNRNIQKANRLIREIRAQIGKLKEWIGELFKARETAPEQPPQSPGLANLLMKYLSVQREKSRKYSQSWQRQHAADELKTVAKAVNYLSEHGISTLDELDAALSSVSDKAYSIREGMKTAEQRMKELQKLMEYGRNYQTYKPIQDEYRQIRWKGKQEKFAEARRAELTLWDAANRYLHAHLPEGVKTLPISAWEKEYTALKAQREAEYETLKDTRAEVAELQKIRKCVDIALRADQPAQTQSRTKRQEQER